MNEGIFIFNTSPISLEETEIKGEKKDFLKGFISTDDIDLVNDIVTQKCLDSMINQLKSRTVKLDFEHESFRGETDLDMAVNKTKIPLGKRVDWQRKANGVEVTWELNPTWKQVNSKGDIVRDYKDIKFNLKNGFFDGFSIAYIPTLTEEAMIDGKSIRLLNDLNLLNVALTGNSINPKASVLEIFAKSLNYLKDKDHNHTSDKLTKLKENKMSEDTQKQDQAKPEETSKEESKEEANATTTEDSKTEEATAEPAKENPEVKALKDQLDKTNKELAEIKAMLKKPVRKGISEQSKEVEAKSVETTTGPLDYIC